MKKIIVFIVGLTLSISAFGAFGSANVDMSYRLSGTAGGFMKDGKVDKWLQNPVFGGTFAMEFHATGRLEGLQQWNNASVGLGVTYLNLGNNEKLGSAIATYTYLSIPFYNSPHFRIGIRPIVGLAFCTKTYRNTLPEGYEPYFPGDGGFQNEANQSIGSILKTTGLVPSEQQTMGFPPEPGSVSP